MDESRYMNTHEIPGIEDLHSVVRDLHCEWQTIDFWWRGHPRKEYQLVPGARRNSCTRFEEEDLANRFIREAITRYPNCPTTTEVAEDPRWLFLMQHYRLKTRLLDWTESPLIASFFCVKDNQDKDGVVWALNPWILNQDQTTQKAILDVKKGLILTQSPFAEEQGLDIDKVIAVNTQQRDIRMFVQQSVFTMHGSKNPLEEYEGRDKFLRKYTIPASSKKNLWVSLQQFGVKDHYLFPDLDHLANELNRIFSSKT